MHRSNWRDEGGCLQPFGASIRDFSYLCNWYGKLRVSHFTRNTSSYYINVFNSKPMPLHGSITFTGVLLVNILKIEWALCFLFCRAFHRMCIDHGCSHITVSQ